MSRWVENVLRCAAALLLLPAFHATVFAQASASKVPASVSAPAASVSPVKAGSGPSSRPVGRSSAWPGIGRVATAAEVAAWDIDVRPDFKGLPAGKGTVAHGQEIWDTRCAMCHGTFGESNEVFTPIVGNTTPKDMERGRVASLIDNKTPQRTTLMKVATVSTLWDYIYRAMPWYAPRSLTVDETYAVLAYILNLAEMVPDDFVLSNDNMASIQARMPNRNGMSRAHGMWNVKDKPDVQGDTCMNDCKPFITIGSVLPDYARDAHGNLAQQNRTWGPYRGVDTTQAPLPMLPADAQRGLGISPPTPENPSMRIVR